MPGVLAIGGDFGGIPLIFRSQVREHASDYSAFSVQVRSPLAICIEGPAHLSSQFIEKLADRAIIKIAGVLRENLACENGNRLAMACGRTSGIGIDDFASGKHPG